MTVKKERKTNINLSQNVDKLLNVNDADLEAALKYYDVPATALEEMTKNIHDWYDKQPHLPNGQLHDQVIIRHLITRAFSVERVKEKIENYYTARLKMPEILTRRDPLQPEFEKYLKDGYWVILPQLTPEKYRITIFRVKEPGDIIMTDLVKLVFMMGDYRLWNDLALGEEWIFDFQNITLQNAVQFTPVFTSKIVFYLTCCVGPKIKGLHLVNMPIYAETALNLFKKAMKAKLVKRIHVYNSFEEVMQKFPKYLFPKDLGGEQIRCQEITDEWMKTLRSPPWRQYFIEQDSIKIENKTESSSKSNKLFGIEGSFRKLDLD